MIGRLMLRRLAFLLFVIVGISLLTFSLSHVIPSDPAKMMAGPRASKSQVARIRAEYGLDRPLTEQYAAYLAGLARLDFGESLMSHRPVREDLRQYLPASIELGSYAFLLALLIGVPLGIVAGARQGTAVDHVARLISITGLALPVFWLALLAQFFFFGKLGWLPDGQRLPISLEPPPPVTHLYSLDALIAGQWEVLWAALRHLALPVSVLAFGSIAVITRMVRGGMIEALGQDYIRTARAKGIAGRAVVLRHAVKNAFLPAVTAIGLQAGVMISGAFLVESVFSWPGVGRYTVQAITAIDYNAIMSTTLVIAVVFLVLNLIVDILYLLLDPRIELA